MHIIPLEKCCRTDFHLRFLDSVELPQKTKYPAFSSIDRPKKQDMLLLVRNCQTKYTTKSGKVLDTNDGDVVYVPKGSQYRVECVKDSPNSSSLQINFLLFDQQNSPFILADEIIIFKTQNPMVRSLFEKSVMLSKNATVYPTIQKAVLFELLCTLAEGNGVLSSNSIIDAGINYLLSHYTENPSVSFLASLCYVSDEYFRKLFKLRTGQSPNEFKNSLRIKKAELYLLYSDMPIVQISEQLSFATVSHFIKCFKDVHGCSPLVFRNSTHHRQK